MNLADLLKGAIAGDIKARKQVMQLNPALAPHMAEIRALAHVFDESPNPVTIAEIRSALGEIFTPATVAAIRASLSEFLPEGALPDIQQQLAQMRLDLER